jgi:putative membrane protein
MRHLSFFRKAFPALIAASFSVLAFDGSASAGTLSDSQILGIYIQVNSFDIETALLGQSQAHSEKIRMLAEHVAADHIGVRQAALALAAKCKVSIQLPEERTAAAVEHGKSLQNFMSLKGKAFDTAYLQHEVKFHRAAIDAVRGTLLPSATCPDLQTHLKEILPAFEHHLAQTEALARELAAR